MVGLRNNSEAKAPSTQLILFCKSRAQSDLLNRLDKKCHGRYFNIGYDHNGMTWDLNCLSPCIFEKVASSSGTYSF